MQDVSHLCASVRILELDLADSLQRLYDKNKLPIQVSSAAPRQEGLCAKLLDALGRRAKEFDHGALYLPHILTLFAREKKIVLSESVAGRDVFVVLDFALPDRQKVSSEFFLLCNTLATDTYLSLAQQAGQAARLNGANKVHLIMPNFAYARQDKDHGERGPISASITAQNLEPYYDTVTCVHLHSPAIKGMFRAISLNEISPNEIYAPSFVCRDPDTYVPIERDRLSVEGVNRLFNQLCIVSPDTGGAKNARDFAKYCKKFAVHILGVPENAIADISMAQIDKRRAGANVSEIMNVLGREYVQGRVAIIIDDMGDTFGTATQASEALIEAEARNVEFWGTHGYFSGKALDRIQESKISRVNITNSMALSSEARQAEATNVIDISPILAQVVIDLSTAPSQNLRIASRHMVEEGPRRALGRYVFAMMPHLGQ